jgi:hypothetical protein
VDGEYIFYNVLQLPKRTPPPLCTVCRLAGPAGWGGSNTCYITGHSNVCNLWLLYSNHRYSRINVENEQEYLIIHVVTTKSDKTKTVRLQKRETLSTVHDIAIARLIIHL